MTYYAGKTSEHFFKTDYSIAEAASVFLQIAKTLSELISKGCTHNDIKYNNICVRIEDSGPVATVIDLGLVTPVGWSNVYPTQEYPENYPWIAPELLQNTYPSSEASDVYSLAFTMEDLFAYKQPPLSESVINWILEGSCFDPTKRPTLAALVEILQPLCEPVLTEHHFNDTYEMQPEEVKEKENTR